MRASLFGSIVVLMACGESPKPVDTPKPAPPPSATVVEVPDAAPAASATPTAPPFDAFTAARTIMEGFNRQDSLKYAGAYTADAVLAIAGSPDYKGAQIVAEHQRMIEAFPDTRMSGFRLLSAGNKDGDGGLAVLEWVLSATQQSDWMGVKQAHKGVGVRGVSVMWLAGDGTIKNEHRYYDVANMLGQVGGLPGKWRGIPMIPAQMKSVPATGAASESTNVDTVKKMLAAIEAKNEADFLGAQNDSVELDDLTRAESYLTIADTKKMYDAWTKSFTDLKIAITNAWGFGDFVAIEMVVTGKQTGAFDGYLASGKALSLHKVGVYQMKDGKVLKGWTYGNGLEMRVQMGTYKMPPMAPLKPAGK